MENQNKQEQVASYLREKILSRFYARGSKIKQTDISSELEVGLGTVREALRLLAVEGYVSGAYYRSARAAPLCAAAADEIKNLRATLEAQLIQRAVLRISSKEISDLQATELEFASAVHSGNKLACRSANYQFHRNIYQLADQPQTLNIVKILWAKYPFDVIYSVHARGTEAVREHRQIMIAIESGLASEAAQATRQHIESGWMTLEKSLRPR